MLRTEEDRIMKKKQKATKQQQMKLTLSIREDAAKASRNGISFPVLIHSYVHPQMPDATTPG